MSIFNHFKHLALSSDQEIALTRLESFFESSNQVFMLKGYAGSGKTTILEGLVKYLDASRKDFVIMAPTGRAAKILRDKTSYEAFTVHKSIYSYEDMVEMEDGDSFFYNYQLRNNNDVSNKIFIIDEASMLSNSKSEAEFFRFGSGYLLSDLISYTKVANKNAKTKIIFVGDPCQLPPVTDNSSKAFDPAYLNEKFNISSEETEMKEVKRQGAKSGILMAAKKIRKSISSGYFNDFNLRDNGKDIINPSYETFMNSWLNAASPKIIIASKNKTCLALNLQIRERKFGKTNLPIQKTDIVIIGGNNYRKGILNGEFAVINNVSAETETRTVPLKGKALVTLKWRTVELIFSDVESNGKIVRGKVLENFIYGHNTLKPEESQALYVDFRMRHENLKPKTEEFKDAIIKDEYFNAILIKFGYVVTCHKAQGGEWENVFTIWDHDITTGFNCFSDNQSRTGKTNNNFYRWAYTAITRASKTIYAINPPFFNSYSSMAFIEEDVARSLNELTGNEIQAEDLIVDDEMLEQLSYFELLEKPVQLQDHFIKVRHAVRKQYIEIIGWEKKNLEIWFYFKRENQTAAFKTWINKVFIFNDKYQKIASNSNSEELLDEIEKLLKSLPNVSIKRNTAETIVGKIMFDLDLEEKYPFTKNLFDDLSLLLEPLGIFIDDVEHLQYRERYTLTRNQEMVVIDFEYKDNGFFGRIVPIQNKSNSKLLISEIQNAVETFRQE